VTNPFPAFLSPGSSDNPIGASDYLSLQSRGIEVMHVPILVAGISFFVNIPGLTYETAGPLNLTACLLASVLQGRITGWNDPQILYLNPALRALVKQHPSAEYRLQVLRRR
jgi:ABC-type phosphate transport system substrate-binding protein